MGYTTAVDMLTHLKNGMALFNPSSLVQISMDGPNVNWKLCLNLFHERKGEELLDLIYKFSGSSNIYIGSCSLHVIHGRFEKGAKESGWNLGNTL